ncbi:MAG: DUF721 domain-containing protein [Selenomonadaceae bacterium]|nr:DUF721 domain-containing protein [Selenomonadaceae bacterium]
MRDIGSVLQGSIRSLGAEHYQRFLSDEIIFHWDTLVDKSISASVQPIVFENGVLFVHAKSSAFKDQLKFFVEDIIDAINERFGNGEQKVREIRPAKPFQVANFNKKSRRVEQPEQVEEKTDDIVLTPEEIAHCEASVQKIADEELRTVALQTLLSRAKYKKFRLANGWHKCKSCDSLCEETETLCEVCRLKEHEKIKRLLFEIFYDTPWLASEEVKKIFAEKFPNLREQCPIDFVNSTRASLIQLLAGHLARDEADEDSNDIMRIVMLERQLPPEKVTPAIIRRTLGELHFNFADPIRFHRYKFSKFRNLQRK